MKDHSAKLNDIVMKGLAENIRQAEEAVTLRDEISARAFQINEAGFGALFGGMQMTLGRYSILSVTRLFDPPDDNYQSKSIPSALNHVRFTADYLKITDREFVIKRLIAFGHDKSQFKDIPDPWITQLVRKEFADRLPKAGDPESSELSKALAALLTAGNKPVTPPKTVEESDALSIIDAPRDLLLGFAKDFVAIIGQGYLNTPFEPDTRTAGSDLKQLFIRAGIVADS